MAISGWLGFPCNNNETEDGHDWESTLCSWGKSMKILQMLGVPAMFLLILILSASRSSSQSVSWSPAVNPLAPSPWTFWISGRNPFSAAPFCKKRSGTNLCWRLLTTLCPAKKHAILGELCWLYSQCTVYPFIYIIPIERMKSK